MATFLQVTAHGGYTTGEWSGEIAQCGWSFPIASDDPLTTAVTNADIEEPDYDDSTSSGSWAHGTFLRGFGGELLTEAVQTTIAGHVYDWLTAMKVYQMSTCLLYTSDAADE